MDGFLILAGVFGGLVLSMRVVFRRRWSRAVLWAVALALWFVALLFASVRNAGV